MKQWLLKAGVADADGLILQQVSMPEPGPGEVRIRVHAISMNYRDQMILKGVFGRLPGRDLVPLSDVAGEIDSIGSGVEDWKPGDHITNIHFRGWEDGSPSEPLSLGLGGLDEDGVLAEYVVLPATRVTRAPRNLHYAEAATLPVAGVTAWNALFADHAISSGQKVMTIGSGGVSLFVVQLARAVGAEVYVAVRQDVKGEQLKHLGISGFINSTSYSNWGQVMFDQTGGLHKVVETVGVNTINQSLAALGFGGEIAFVGLFEGSSSGNLLGLNSPLIGKAGILRSIAVGSARMHRNLVDMVERHDIHPVIDQRIPFDEAPKAFRTQNVSPRFGKVIIEVL